MNKITIAILTTMTLLPSLQSARAGSATWSLNPTTNAWSTAANWTPATVPNGPSDIATFDVSNTTGISSSGATVNSIAFNAGASAFTIAVSTGKLKISGAGISNKSGLRQNFTTNSTGNVYFLNNATAGSATAFSNPDNCTTSFFDTASAGTAAFFNSSETGLTTSGTTHFYDSATAADASITNQGSTAPLAQHGGWTFFHDTSTAANATIINEGSTGGGGLTEFFDQSTAANAIFINKHGGANGGDAGIISFNDSSTAADATFLNEGGTAPGEPGGGVVFQGAGCSAGNAVFTCEGGAASEASGSGVTIGYLADGGNATFMINGGTASGAFGAQIYLTENGSAGNSTIILNGGVNGGYGSVLFVESDGKGANARLEVYGNSVADLQNTLGVIPNTIGSIEGDGSIRLADTQLTVGSNNLSTTFSGLIEDYGYYHETGGSLIKIGQGTLALTHDNTYTGGTIVKRGILLINNTTGSGTGSGKVQVEGGALGGKGFIDGPVTIGTGGPRRAVLVPGIDGLGVLTMQRTLTFGTNGTYNWNVETQAAKGDGATANGLTISSGALFTIFPRHNATVAIGTVFTAIDNTAATPIAGTFSNLADGSNITIGSNTFQANYEGGDGNDLTLTVIP